MPGNNSEGIGVFSGNLNFYNRRRPHSSLDSSTPDQAYFTDLPIRAVDQPRQTLHYRCGKSFQTTEIPSFRLGRRANVRALTILPALLVGATLALSVTPAAAWWQFVMNGPNGERQISPHFETEEECKSVLKITEAELAKKYPNRYPLVGSCEQYR
jgi:hypothetical protein